MSLLGLYTLRGKTVPFHIDGQTHTPGNLLAHRTRDMRSRTKVEREKVSAPALLALSVSVHRKLGGASYHPI